MARFECTLFFTLLLCPLAAHASVTVQPANGSQIPDGDSPNLIISGLKPSERATVHVFRLTTLYPPKVYKGSPILAHAQATFEADSRGRITVDSAHPIAGTYAAPDPLGLLWSGTPLALAGTPGDSITEHISLADEQDILIRIDAPSLGTGNWRESHMHLTDNVSLLAIQPVVAAGLNAFFARPKSPSAKPLPSILILHGSEGGSVTAARASAIRFANLGYAALAVNYFAWPSSDIAGIPQALVDIPVETLATARAWLAQQPNVDTTRVALWGVSKGAELALVAASHYAWVDRVVACVPSSVVWSGFGRAAAPGEIFSSWSINGNGLPYISYDNYQDVPDKFSAAYVHRRSLLKATPAERAAARIPIERTHARLLLIASDNDVVWPSGDMTREIERTLADANESSIAQTLRFENASHYICGDGSEPRRINPVHKPEGHDPTPEADAHAAAAGWQATKAFLSR